MGGRESTQTAQESTPGNWSELKVNHEAPKRGKDGLKRSVKKDHPPGGKLCLSRLGKVLHRLNNPSDTMDFSTFHPMHGALAGLAVYALTGKPVPALVVGGSLYAYMTVYGHNLPPGVGAAPATSVDTVEIPLMPLGPISHDPRYPTMLVPVGYTS